MVQHAMANSDTLPPSADVAALAATCDQDCGEAATLSYRWEWGATGTCCAHHAALLQQTAVSLKRAVVIHPIALAAPAPLLRDERIQLTARALVLEAELTEAQAQGLSVYPGNRRGAL